LLQVVLAVALGKHQYQMEVVVVQVEFYLQQHHLLHQRPTQLQ
jgi:hypothetical protein